MPGGNDAARRSSSAVTARSTSSELAVGQLRDAEADRLDALEAQVGGVGFRAELGAARRP